MCPESQVSSQDARTGHADGLCAFSIAIVAVTNN
jgi:hypothetical protein